MKINGNKIAETILLDLKKKINDLKKQGTTPKLAIILIGEDPISKSYIRQKETTAKKLGLGTVFLNLPSSIIKEDLKEKVEEFNNDSSINGIIIQRPLPSQIDIDFATNIIVKNKDVDGFREDSFFESPISQAVLEILKEIYPENLKEILKTKKIAVIGKGETGGEPIIKLLKEQGIDPIIIDTKTQNPETLISKSDIIISTVGKPNVINTKDLKQNVILIGVGMYKDESGKFQADYNQDEIEKIASFWTQVPGGVGPLTVAFLLKNLVLSAAK